MELIFSIIIGVVVLLLILTNIHIVPQSEQFVIERLGAYRTTWGTGVHIKVPLIDKVSNKITLKEKVLDFPPQSVITKDTVSVDIDSVLYYQITDAKAFSYGAEQPLIAIKNLTTTSLRNLIGETDLDGTLTSRDVINSQLRTVLDEASDVWGIKVNRVEIKDIVPPEGISQSMEKAMRAERERREAILKAEGEKKSTVLVAEGEKESSILRAEGQKRTAILLAEAEKEREIRIAEGRAEAILITQKATAEGIQMINQASATKEYIALKSLEALEKVANGQATKIIIPSEIQNLAGLVTALKEVASSTTEAIDNLSN